MLTRARLAPLLLLLAACASTPTAPPADTPTQFPQDWLGSWEGEVVMYGPEGERMRFGMKRIVAATDNPNRYSWTTVYSGEAGDQTREYSLLVRDAATGSYAIDEHNGIVLEARLLGDRLYSWFEVQDTELIVREQLLPGPDGALGWSFEILTTQGETVPTGEAIPVESTLPTGLQRAWLRRTGP